MEYPIITCDFDFTGGPRGEVNDSDLTVEPNIVCTALDADVIKTYVRLGMGIGIIAKMAYDSSTDKDLAAIDAGHLFETSMTMIGFRRGNFLRGYMYDFIELFAPHLTREVVDAARNARSKEEEKRLFHNLQLLMC